MKRTFALILLGIVLIPAGCKKDEVDKDCTGLSPTYDEEIFDIVNQTCNLSGCHVSAGTLPDFTSYEDLKELADNGKLERRVIDKQNMPPFNSPGRLPTEEELQLIYCWIQDGAPEN